MLFIEAGQPIPEGRLDEFEHAVGVSLPASYKQFLLQYNDGRPFPDTIDVPGLVGSPTDIQTFLGIGTEIESCDIQWHLSIIQSCLPAHHIPIATDSYGAKFCLDLNTGQIFFIDTAAAPEDIYFVAEDFDDFLSKIREY